MGNIKNIGNVMEWSNDRDLYAHAVLMKHGVVLQQDFQ